MRIYETDYLKPTLLFVEDVPNGVICQCPFCSHEIAINNKSQECPNCKRDLVFPTWASW